MKLQEKLDKTKKELEEKVKNFKQLQNQEEELKRKIIELNSKVKTYKELIDEEDEE